MEWGFIGIMVIKLRFCQRMPLLIDPAQIKSGLLKKERGESLRWMRWSYTQFVFLFPREPLFPLPPICQSSCPSSSSETTPPLFSPKHRLSRPDWQVYTRRKVVETAPVRCFTGRCFFYRSCSKWFGSSWPYLQVISENGLSSLLCSSTILCK